MTLSILLSLLSHLRAGEPLTLQELSPNGRLKVDHAFTNGAVTIERSRTLGGPWEPILSQVSSAPSLSVEVPTDGAAGFFRAQAVPWTIMEGPWTLDPEDLIDLSHLATRLSLPPDLDFVSQFVSSELSAATADLLNGYAGSEDPLLRSALVQEFNRLLKGPSLYDPDRFASVRLSPSTEALLATAPTDPEVVLQLNRLLVEDAYPSEFKQRRAAGFQQFIHSFGLLTTVAGDGRIACPACNSWRPEAEGGPATDATLSSPHIAMADRAGNIYIADKRAHAIRKVDLQGILTTVAGNGQGGLDDTNPAPATAVSLNNPNGLWVQPDGTFYILDRDNGLIRRVDTNGVMAVVVAHGSVISSGRGLWVSPDESLIYYCAGTRIMVWDPVQGLSTYATGFGDLANLAIDPHGRVVVADAGLNQVIRIEEDGTHTLLAGAPVTEGPGGDGQLATSTILEQVRGIWFLPTGAFFVCTDAASQVWYVDTDAHIHLLLDGSASGTHAGDGEWFYNNPGTRKMSNVRQITIDYQGNLLIAESNLGYIRKIRFLPF